VDLAEAGWAWRVAQADLQDVRDADALFAVVNGTPPDEGVMLELGAAIALGKPVFLYRDDFRRCSDSEDYPLNLMVFSGLPQQGWRDWFYEDLSELADPQKALMRWIKSR
jgi:nucleoside 2-deoxyribosyltransferase